MEKAKNKKLGLAGADADENKQKSSD